MLFFCVICTYSVLYVFDRQVVVNVSSVQLNVVLYCTSDSQLLNIILDNALHLAANVHSCK